MSYFENKTPESQGMHSSAIIRFLDAVDSNGLELHRLMIVRHGKCVVRGSYSPYLEEDLHPVYSFSKSLTATAIGFAIQEGILTLEDHLVDFFPELVPDLSELQLADGTFPLPSYPSEYAAKTPEDLLENLKAITIHDLLCMSCGHELEIEDRGATWLHTFFRQPVLYKPGTFFKYNTAGTNVLAAILKKATGQNLTEFLKNRLFEPLKMGEVFCYHLDDPMQVQAGGFGMKLSLEDMAKFTYFMLHDGYWEDKPILPGWYSIMGTKKIDTENDSEGHIKDWACGYGYQCWMGTIEGSFRADGAFGQFGLVFPKQDMIIIINAATEQTQTLLDCVNEYLVSAVNSIELLDSEVIPAGLPKAISIARDAKAGYKQERLEHRIEKLKLPALKNCRNPQFEKKLEDRIYYAKERCSGVKTLIGGAGLLPFADDTTITGMSFLFGDDYLIWLVEEEKAAHIIRASLENRFLRNTVLMDIPYAATARWRSLRCLELEVRRMDALSGTRLLFRFEGDKLYIEADETLMTDGGLGMTVRTIPEFQYQ